MQADSEAKIISEPKGVSRSFIHKHTTSKKSPERRDDSADKASEYDLKFESYIHNLQFPNYKNFSKNVWDALDFSDIGVQFPWEHMNEPLFPVI